MSNKIVVPINWSKLVIELSEGFHLFLVALGLAYLSTTSSNSIIGIALFLVSILYAHEYFNTVWPSSEIYKLRKGTRTREILWNIITQYIIVVCGAYALPTLWERNPIEGIIWVIGIAYILRLFIVDLIKLLNKDVEKNISSVSKK